MGQPNEDLIGTTLPLATEPSRFLIVTGVSATPGYVDVEKRNQHGDFIGCSCRPAAYVRQARDHERSVKHAR